MKPLPPFSGDEPTCIKCGHSGAYTEYKAAGEPRSDGLGGLGLPERLERRCARCDFTWDEATKQQEAP